MEKQGAAVSDWRDLLLNLALGMTIFLTLDQVIEWSAHRWNIDLLQVRSSRADSRTLLAMAGSVWITFRLTDALGFKLIKRGSKLDSEAPLP